MLNVFFFLGILAKDQVLGHAKLFYDPRIVAIKDSMLCTAEATNKKLIIAAYIKTPHLHLEGR